MPDAAVDGSFKGLCCQGEDILQSDPDTHHGAVGLAAMDCAILHDLFPNGTVNDAHASLPGSTIRENDGTFTNAERPINRLRRVVKPRNGHEDGQITRLLAHAMGADGHYDRPAEVARTTPSVAGVACALLEKMGPVP